MSRKFDVIHTAITRCDQIDSAQIQAHREQERTEREVSEDNDLALPVCFLPSHLTNTNSPSESLNLLQAKQKIAKNADVQ